MNEFDFSLDELRELLRCLGQVHNHGYAGYACDQAVAQLQAKLSMRIEAKELVDKRRKKSKEA